MDKKQLIRRWRVFCRKLRRTTRGRTKLWLRPALLLCVFAWLAYDLSPALRLNSRRHKLLEIAKIGSNVQTVKPQLKQKFGGIADIQGVPRGNLLTLRLQERPSKIYHFLSLWLLDRLYDGQENIPPVLSFIYHLFDDIAFVYYDANGRVTEVSFSSEG
jgi:hypothetical protein